MTFQSSLAYTIIVALIFCNPEPDLLLSSVGVPMAAGLHYAETNSLVAETFKSIVTTLEGNTEIGIVAQIDHSANAGKVGLSLPDSRLILFGNPKLGTPLMQENQLTGLDLPQKIAVYQSDTNEKYVVYNSADYLAARYGLTAETLPLIAKALEKITKDATGNEVLQAGKNLPGLHEGIIT